MKRLGLILLVLWGTVVLIPRVLAHAELVSATPAPGSTVETVSEIRLVFSEPVGSGSQIQLSQDFISVAELQPVIDANDATVLVTAVPSLPDGVYTVQWTVTSADGHPIRGSYSLGISSAAQPDTLWYQTTWARLGFLLSGLGMSILILRRWRSPAVPKSRRNS